MRGQSPGAKAAYPLDMKPTTTMPQRSAAPRWSVYGKRWNQREKTGSKRAPEPHTIKGAPAPAARLEIKIK